MHNKSLPLQQELMHKFVIERLKKLNIINSQSGKAIEQLDYEEAKYELVLAAFREINTESKERDWF